MNLQEYNNKYHQGQIGDSHLTDPIGEFYEICKFGDVAAVHFLLHSNEAPSLPDINEHVTRAMSIACYSNNMELLKYLFSLEQSHKIFLTEKNIFYAANSAAKEGHLEILNFFILAEEKNKAPKLSVNKYGNDFLISAARDGHTHVVKYLLTHEDFKNHINIHHDNDLTFKYAIRNNHEALLQILIFDLHITRTKDIDAFLINNLPLVKNAKKMFEIREMEVELTNNLNNTSISKNNHSEKKIKI